MTKSTKAYVIPSATGKFEYKDVQIKDCGVADVEVEFVCSGLCHTDHSMRTNNWGISQYPTIVGHEGIGYVKNVGSNVKHLEVGDKVGVGWLSGSCEACRQCRTGEENICEKGYKGTILFDNCMGGTFSRNQVVDGRFVFKIPDSIPTPNAAPLLCAGITVYSPLRKYVQAGDRVGIISLGGLGHLAIQFAKAMGAHVTLFSSSDSKKDAAMKLGVNEYVNFRKEDDVKRAAASCDFILNTCPYAVDVNVFLGCLAKNGVLCYVGIPNHAKDGIELHMNPIIFDQKSVVGSIVGGSKYQTEMFRVAASHNIVPDVEVVKFGDIETAFDRLLKGDMKKHRFVLAHEEHYDQLSAEAAEYSKKHGH